MPNTAAIVKRKAREAMGAKPKGRLPGVPNKATINAREAIARFVDHNAGSMQRWLEQIEQEQGALAAWKCLNDVIEYHVPKLARNEVTGADGGPITVTINKLA